MVYRTATYSEFCADFALSHAVHIVVERLDFGFGEVQFFNKGVGLTAIPIGNFGKGRPLKKRAGVA